MTRDEHRAQMIRQITEDYLRHPTKEGRADIKAFLDALAHDLSGGKAVLVERDPI